MPSSIIQQCTIIVHMMQKEGIMDCHCHLCHFRGGNKRPINCKILARRRSTKPTKELSRLVDTIKMSLSTDPTY